MRRWIALLLLVLLPLQFSWAALSTYGDNDAPATLHHPEHHATAKHSLTAANADLADTGNGTSAGALCIDCGHCHGSFSGLIAATLTLEQRLLAVSPTLVGDTRRVGHIPAPPERPQWPAFA